MKTLFLDEIRDCIAGRCEGDPTGIAVNGVSTDSREVKAGDLFVAVCGQRFDGHDFVAKAFSSGASGAGSASGSGRCSISSTG